MVLFHKFESQSTTTGRGNTYTYKYQEQDNGSDVDRTLTDWNSLSQTYWVKTV